MESANAISGDWLIEMKRVRKHFSLIQFRILLDYIEEQIKKEYGGVEIEVRDRQIDTYVPAPRIKVRNK